MNKEIYSKFSKIFDDIFDIKKIKLKKTTSAKDISNWDSINNLKLIIVLEKEFKIKFEPDEIVEIQNVGELIKSIEKTISHMESDSDSLITVYWGDHSNENQSELENKLIDRFSFIEMEFQYGGQSNIEAWVVIE